MKRIFELDLHLISSKVVKNVYMAFLKKLLK